MGARGGGRLTGGAELEAAVVPGGCCNPLSAARLLAPCAAGTRSCWRRSRVGTARLGHPAAGRRLPGGRCRRQWGPQRPGLLPGSPARRAPRRPSGGAAARPGAKRPWGQIGRAGREPRPPRTPQSRSRRLEPTSAETKVRKEG